MIRDTVSDDMVNVMLRQMGAVSVETSPAHINLAKFNIGPDLKVTYLYEIKEDDGIYLQRVNPYPMMIGKLYNEQDILHIIGSDLKKFQSAYTSSNFVKFLEVTNNVMTFDKEIENLFMLHNVSFENLDKIHKELEKIHEMISVIAKESPTI